ncbi:two-component system nitrate/nitrite response regulator NarL [Nakamurella flavida]|nr:response regulator transcription factor [Nakamurella flavida]MDP9778467.1 two-component system nitrate/nitrite response regulator NarL [Nakamurella flavida]
MRQGVMVTVVVADDHPMVRDGVVRALQSSGRIQVVAEAGDGRAALAEIDRHTPDVAVLDYRMGELDGAEVAAALRRDGARTRVLLLSAHTESAIVFHGLEQGAAGFLSKDADRGEIVRAVLDCAAGRPVLPPDLAAGLVGEIQLRRTDPAPVLSGREREVLAGMAAGKSVPVLAAELFLAPSTVKTHVQRLYDKLGVSDRGSAVAVGMRHHLLE